jgi:hypothetical protein
MCRCRRMAPARPDAASIRCKRSMVNIVSSSLAARSNGRWPQSRRDALGCGGNIPRRPLSDGEALGRACRRARRAALVAGQCRREGRASRKHANVERAGRQRRRCVFRSLHDVETGRGLASHQHRSGDRSSNRLLSGSDNPIISGQRFRSRVELLTPKDASTTLAAGAFDCTGFT